MSEIIICIIPQIEVHGLDTVSALIWNGEKVMREKIGTFSVTEENVIFTPLIKFFGRDNGGLELEIADKVEESVKSRSKEQS